MIKRFFLRGRLLLFILTPLLSVIRASPQNPPAPSTAFCSSDPDDAVRGYCEFLGRLLDAAQKSTAKDVDALRVELRPLLNLVNPTKENTKQLFVNAVAKQLATQTASTSLIQAANQLRTDQQTGPGSTAAGTTSLVTQAGSATLMSFALDTGVLTRTVNGSTATLNTNADEVYRLVTGSTPDCVMNCPKGGAFESHFLNPLNLAASFALAQSSSNITPASGQASGTTPANVPAVAVPSGAGKLTAFTAKYQIVNKFDPRSTLFRSKWDPQVKLLAPAANLAAEDVNKVWDELTKDKNFQAATSKSDDYDKTLAAAARADPSGKQLVAAFKNIFNQAVSSALKDPALPALVATAVQSLTAFRGAWQDAVNAAAGTLLSTQYTYNKTLNQPITHDCTLIYGQSFKNQGTLTFNGAASIYDTLPAGAKYGRLHYGQVSAEYDRNVTNPQNAYQFQINLAGYWQYQPHPSVLNIPAGTVAPGTTIPLPNGTQEFVGTAGSLWVTQGGLTIKGPGGINIPLAVSWSNKTDLLRGTKVGGQVGISYNFSSIAGLF
jgi:hypothetical protein